MGKSNDAQPETERERALADVARQQLADFETRWRPQQQRLAKGVVDAAAPNSWQRRRAETMAKADTSAAFSGVRDKVTAGAAAAGQAGTAAHKLALAGVDQDQAISSGASAVAADQAAEDTMVSGLNAVTALGRGEKATAVDGMTRSAGLSAAQARADADRSLASRMGNARLAGQAVGIGAGLYMDRPPAAEAGSDVVGLDGATLVRRGQRDG
jgi:hypothetical protein